MKNKEIFGANILYLLVAILLIIIGSVVQSNDLLKGLLITEYVLVLLPVLIYLFATKKSIIKELKINKIKLKDILLIIVITVLAYPVIIFINYTFITVLDTFIEFKKIEFPIPSNLKEYALYFIVAAMSAGICEEIFFRGFMLSSYRRLGKNRAIIISALLFGVFHFNIQNIIGPVILGIIFGNLVYRTNSIFAGIVGHITNNTVALTLGLYTSYLMNKKEIIEVVERGTTKNDIIISAIFLGIIAIICSAIIGKLYEKVSISTEYYLEESKYDKNYNKNSLILWIPVLIVIIMYYYFMYIQLFEM